MTEPNETVGEASTAADPEENTTTEATTEENGESQQEKKSEETKSSDDKDTRETKLYVGNLPDNCRKDELEAVFSKYGVISQCDRVKNFAFVHMVGDENAQKAISELDDSEFMGTHIQVQVAKSKGKPAEDECFQCGKRGHWAKDCSQRRSYGGYGRDRYQPYRSDRPPPYGGYGQRREAYGRQAPRDYYGDYYDRRPPPPRDYGGAPSYRSRSPVGYTGYYEGYGTTRSGGYGGRRY